MMNPQAEVINTKPLVMLSAQDKNANHYVSVIHLNLIFHKTVSTRKQLIFMMQSMIFLG